MNKKTQLKLKCSNDDEKQNKTINEIETESLVAQQPDWPSQSPRGCEAAAFEQVFALRPWSRKCQKIIT